MEAQLYMSFKCTPFKFYTDGKTNKKKNCQLKKLET